MAQLPGPESAVSKLNLLMHKVYAPIVTTAFAQGLALIDLPNTFDIKNNDLCVHYLVPMIMRVPYILLSKSAHFQTSFPCNPSYDTSCSSDTLIKSNLLLLVGALS